MLSVDREKARHYGDEQGRYWSVSQVIEVVMGDKGFMDPIALQRGTDVHQIFALMLGEQVAWCDGPDVPPEYQGYANAIMRWIEQVKPKPMMLERMLRHKALPYAGTMDYVGLLGPDYGVLDLKTGSPQRWHSLQVHAYRHLLYKAAKMWILYIDDDGSFKQMAVKYDARQWAAFQNGLSILQWRAA